MRWGGRQLRVGDWVTHAAGMTCMALSAHEMVVTPALEACTGLGHLELSTVSGRAGGCKGGLVEPSACTDVA